MTKSKVNLVEIDLLRKGLHTVAAPESWIPHDVAWTYLISLHRGSQGRRFEVWAVPLADRLPRICVPLGEGDPDMVVDLRNLLDRGYDEGKYERRIDYQAPCEPALGKEDAAWAAAILEESRPT